MKTAASHKRWVLWFAILGLVILHQDFWQWDNATLVFGFLPYSLAYHAALSMLAAIVWWLAVQFFWPSNLEVADSIANEQEVALASSTGLAAGDVTDDRPASSPPHDQKSDVNGGGEGATS